jgi:hypothetical protein
MVSQNVTRDGALFLVDAYKDDRYIVTASLLCLVPLVHKPKVNLAFLSQRYLSRLKILGQPLVLQGKVVAVRVPHATQVEIRTCQEVINYVVHLILPAAVEHRDF